MVLHHTVDLFGGIRCSSKHASPNFLDNRERGQGHMHQIRGIHLGIAIKGAEVGVEQSAVEESAQPVDFFPGKVAARPVHIVEMIFQSDYDSLEYLLQIGSGHEAPLCLFRAESSHGHIVAVGHVQGGRGRRDRQELRLPGLGGPLHLHRLDILEP